MEKRKKTIKIKRKNLSKNLTKKNLVGGANALNSIVNTGLNMIGVNTE